MKPPFLPNLARHFHEARRELLALAGIQVAPWYRLTSDERQVAETEAEILREALRRATAEQRAVDTLLSRPGPRPARPQPGIDRPLSPPRAVQV